MSGSLQNRLQKYEVAPPASVWESISSRLDDEYSPTDAIVSNRLQNLSVAPPADAWQHISAELDAPHEARPSGKVVSMFIRRTAVAVVIALLLVAGSIYFFSNDFVAPQKSSTASRQEESVPQKSETLSREEAVKTGEVDNADAYSPRAAENQLAKVHPPAPPRSNRRRVPAATNVVQPDYSTADYVYPERDLDYEAAQSIPQTVRTSHNISVSAPPIRDGNGQIIMDLDVIRKPGQQYITVTSPNGDQTRISNKFINCLRYLNGSLSVNDSHPDAAECRNKFNEWRDRLLRQGEFIPSGDNFFDIIELKELIQE